MKRAFLVLLMIGVAVPAAGATAALSLVSSRERLTMTNVTPRGSVVLAGMSIRSEGGVRRMRRFAEVLIADGEGGIEYTPPGKVPVRSVWCAVDLTTGSRASAGGPELPGFLIALPDSVLRRDSSGLIDGLDIEGVWWDVVLVRPGGGSSGAWHTTGYDGAGGDRDTQLDGKLRILFESAQPLRPEFRESPNKIRKDDVIVVIDLRRLRLGVTTIQ